MKLEHLIEAKYAYQRVPVTITFVTGYNSVYATIDRDKVPNLKITRELEYSLDAVGDELPGMTYDFVTGGEAWDEAEWNGWHQNDGEISDDQIDQLLKAAESILHNNGVNNVELDFEYDRSST